MMAKIGITNMFLGFCIIFLAASAGSFVANDIAYKFIREKSLLDTWSSLMMKSAHGHTNLFGILHICFGLTMPYSNVNKRGKLIQTIGLGMGTFAMSGLMFLRGIMIPNQEFDYLGVIIGICLSAALVSIASHAFGLLLKIRE